MPISPPAPETRKTSYWLPMFIIGVLFFIFGFVTWLNGPLITFAKLAFQVPDTYAFLVPSAFYLSYFFLALPSSTVLKRTGMKKGMALGLFVMAIGAVIFSQFAPMRIYAGVLTGLFVIGAGLALLQTAANPYVSILGPIESAAQRIAVMGICNKGAGALAPIVIGALALHGIDKIEQRVKVAATPAVRDAVLNGFAAQMRWPYLAMAAILIVIAIWVMRSALPEIRPEGANRETAGARGILRIPHFWLGVVCLFLYVGVEVMAGDAIGVYGQGFGLPLGETTHFTSLTLIAMLVGYALGFLLTPRFISQERYLGVSAVLGTLLTLVAWLTTGFTSVLFVAALGFANAMMWPAIFPLAIRGLGRRTELGSAFLIMAIAGGAIIPQLFAHLKLHINFQLAFMVLMVPCYLYILFYAAYGSSLGLRRAPLGAPQPAANSGPAL
ncbi:MAG TPA: sugar MFS transporter [Gammaproteobacteria bacterium]|nr:sugar MFS transporter [Gammaproteobacteria bacterium]